MRYLKDYKTNRYTNRITKTDIYQYQSVIYEELMLNLI